MGAKQQTVDFKASVISTTVSPGSAGNLVATANVEGSSEAFGPFVGTVIVTPAGHPYGTWQYHAYAYPPDGSTLIGSGQGRFETIGATRWRTQGLIELVHGTTPITMRLDAEADLEKRSWVGKLLPLD